jgi:hypothetical protein
VVDIDLSQFFGTPSKLGISNRCNSCPGKREEPPHLGSSLGLMEVTK